MELIQNLNLQMIQDFVTQLENKFVLVYGQTQKDSIHVDMQIICMSKVDVLMRVSSNEIHQKNRKFHQNIFQVLLLMVRLHIRSMMAQNRCWKFYLKMLFSR